MQLPCWFWSFHTSSLPPRWSPKQKEVKAGCLFQNPCELIDVCGVWESSRSLGVRPLVRSPGHVQWLDADVVVPNFRGAANDALQPIHLEGCKENFVDGFSAQSMG